MSPLLYLGLGFLLAVSASVTNSHKTTCVLSRLSPLSAAAQFEFSARPQRSLCLGGEWLRCFSPSRRRRVRGVHAEKNQTEPLPPQRASADSSNQVEDLSKGQITERVVCVANAAQSYALYLPSNYTPTRQWPILYAFDPGARGKVPVERFKDAAEKYGWIVAGSNNSRNGSMQGSLDAWKAIWEDTHERFAVDQSRVYLTGFSGGARTAVYFANLCKDCITGVIACGAGFPAGLTPAPAMHFVFFGAVGVDDFNFAELRTLDDSLLKTGIAHEVRVFAGRHEWAPQAVATEAVEWMELQAMKAGKRQRDEKLISELWQQYIASGTALESEHKPYEAYQLFAGLIDSFKGLHETREAEKLAGRLRDNRAVKDALRDERQQISSERDSEREIYTLIAASTGEESFDSGVRLRTVLMELQKSAQADSDIGPRRVARRVLEGLYVGFIEQGNLLQAQKNYVQAATKFELSAQVLPDRPGAFFYLAQAYALSGNRKQSLQALKNAINKGFSDRAAITDNKAFESLRNEPQYLQIIQSLKDAH